MAIFPPKVEYDEEGELRQAKQRAKDLLGREPWYRGAGIGAAEDGEHFAVTVRVAPGFGAEAERRLAELDLPVFLTVVEIEAWRPRSAAVASAWLRRRVARAWVRQFQDPHLRPAPRRKTPTQLALSQMRLPVSDARFDGAMAMAARDMGGTYVPATGTIKLPPGIARPGDRTFPTELRVLYRKGPRAAIMRDPNAEGDAAQLPCVSFDLIPNVSGDPRRSKVYRSFRGDAASSKVMFGNFLGWLKIVSRALKCYVRSQEAERGVPFAQLVAGVDAVARADGSGDDPAGAHRERSGDGRSGLRGTARGSWIPGGSRGERRARDPVPRDRGDPARVAAAWLRVASTCAPDLDGVVARST